MRIRAEGTIKDPIALGERRLPGRSLSGRRVSVPSVPAESSPGDDSPTLPDASAELLPAQPATSPNVRTMAALRERWERGWAILERYDGTDFGDTPEYGELCAKLRFLEFGVLHVAATPTNARCPHCTSEAVPEGSAYPCFTHAEAELWAKVNRLRVQQGW